MADKPSEHLNWNIDGSNVETPDATVRERGYKKGEVYPSKVHSWALNLIDKWLKFLDELTHKNKIDIENLGTELANHNHDDDYAKKDGSTDFPKIIINSATITVVD